MNSANDSMKLEETLKYRQTKGVQKPVKWHVGEAGEEETYLESFGEPIPTEQAGTALETENEWEEVLGALNALSVGAVRVPLAGSAPDPAQRLLQRAPAGCVSPGPRGPPRRHAAPLRRVTATPSRSAFSSLDPGLSPATR